jgi:hypothetical protein
MKWIGRKSASCVIDEIAKENEMPKCIYCGGREFFEGPSGGMSTNILCANDACRHWFNWTPAIGELDDLNRVEPTAAERTAEQTKQRAAADAAREARFEEGRAAYRERKSLHTLRVEKPYGGYSEATANVDRIMGYIEAMGNDVHEILRKAEAQLERIGKILPPEIPYNEFKERTGA